VRSEPKTISNPPGRWVSLRLVGARLGSHAGVPRPPRLVAGSGTSLAARG